MNMKKITYIILMCIIVIGIIFTAVKGLNMGLKYSNNKQIQIYLGQKFDNNDIKQIVKDIVGNKQVIVQKVEEYEEIVSITVKEITDEQIEKLNSKINEKYGIENTVADDLKIIENAKLDVQDLIKPYIFPVALSLVIIIIYVGIRFRKLDILEVLGKILGLNVLAQLVFVSILAIIRIPINIITLPTSIAIYIIITLIIFNNLETKQKEMIQEEKK